MYKQPEPVSTNNILQFSRHSFVTIFARQIPQRAFALLHTQTLMCLCLCAYDFYDYFTCLMIVFNSLKTQQRKYKIVFDRETKKKVTIRQWNRGDSFHLHLNGRWNIMSVRNVPWNINTSPLAQLLFSKVNCYYSVIEDFGRRHRIVTLSVSLFIRPISFGAPIFNENKSYFWR